MAVEHLTSAEDLIAASSLGADGMAELCARTPDDLTSAIRNQLLPNPDPVAAQYRRAVTSLRTAKGTSRGPLAALVRFLQEYSARRDYRYIQRRAEWIEEARNAPTLQSWIDDTERLTDNR